MHVDVSPSRFRWARERARMTSAALARRFPKLEQWESGEVRPTLKQLENFAKATYAPIGFFFLPDPPQEQVPIPDFRTVREAVIARPSPDLLDTLYICQQRQEWYRDFARTEGEETLAFVGSLTTDTPVETAAHAIRLALHFSVEERQSMGTWAEALRCFIEQADAAGILVMVSGVVGNNNRRKLAPDEFRGFALSDAFAPLVFINGADSKSAQMFTLAYEIAHLWLGATALSDIDPRSTSTIRVEQWCNQVAAELLVPLAIANEPDRSRSVGRKDTRHTYLSKRFARAMAVSTLEGRSTFIEAIRLLGSRKVATLWQMGGPPAGLPLTAGQ